MSRKSQKRTQRTVFVPKEKTEGIGPFRVTATVFGCYTWGKLKGHTNPKAFVRLTVFGDTVKKAIAKLSIQRDEKGKIIPGDAFYRIEEVVDEGREAIRVIEMEPEVDTSPEIEDDEPYMDAHIESANDFVPGPSAYLGGPVEFVAETEGRL